MKSRWDRHEESTGRFRTQLHDAFDANTQMYEQVGAALARWLESKPGRPRVLVVEDNLALLEHYRRSLADVCDTLLAIDGEEAYDLLAATRTLDLAILDLKLPRGNGFAVAKQIRERWRETPVPILVVSGFLSDDTREAFRRLGEPVEFFDKPPENVVEFAKRLSARGPR